MATVKKNIYWSTLTSILQIYTGSVIFILFAKLMTLSDFGILTFGFSLAGLLSVLADFGHSLMVIKEYPQQKNPKQYLTNVFSQKTLLSAVTFLLAFIYVSFYDGEAYKVGLLFVIYAVLASFVSYIQAVLRIKNNFFEYTKLSFIYAFLVTLVMLYYFFYSISLFKLTLLLIASKTIQLVFASISIYKDKLLGFSFNTALQKTLISKAWTYGLHSVMGIFYFTIDTQIISMYLTERDVALYQSVFRVILILLMASDILSNVFLPYLSSLYFRKKEAIDAVSNKINMLLLILGASLFLFFTTFYKPIILALYKPEYLEAKSIIIPLSIVVFLRTIASLFGNLLTISNNQIYRTKTVFITLILSLITNLIMIPRYGINGAAWSSVLVHVVLFSCYYIFSKKEFKSLKLINKENSIIVFITLILFGIIQLFSVYSLWVNVLAILCWIIIIIFLFKSNNNYKFYQSILSQKGV